MKFISITNNINNGIIMFLEITFAVTSTILFYGYQHSIDNYSKQIVILYVLIPIDRLNHTNQCFIDMMLYNQS